MLCLAIIQVNVSDADVEDRHVRIQNIQHCGRTLLKQGRSGIDLSSKSTFEIDQGITGSEDKLCSHVE